MVVIKNSSEEILSHINSSFPSSFVQVFYTICSANNHFSTPTLRALSLKKLILGKIPTFAFLLINFFAQAEKFGKMHH